jgi:hypothetical protein
MQEGTIINGIEYGWSDIVFNVDGQLVENITAIEYADKQEKEDMFAAGRYAQGRGRGRIKNSGKITIGFEEVQRLRAKSSTGSLNGLKPFDIIVNYQPENGAAVVNHILKGCEFDTDETKWKEGDMRGLADLNLHIFRIVRK